jgi:two-component system CheB/CheR fusion protein
MALDQVVVADDNPCMTTALRVFLERWGWKVVVTYDGPSAVAAIREVAPAVALIDIGLPLLDGLGVARAVRREAMAPLRLVALSGYGDEHHQLALQAGFDQYLSKPFDPKVLRAAMPPAPASPLEIGTGTGSVRRL